MTRQPSDESKKGLADFRLVTNICDFQDVRPEEENIRVDRSCECLMSFEPRTGWHEQERDFCLRLASALSVDFCQEGSDNIPLHTVFHSISPGFRRDAAIAGIKTVPLLGEPLILAPGPWSLCVIVDDDEVIGALNTGRWRDTQFDHRILRIAVYMGVE